jgi:tagatose 1,6-diphosphate aldolase
VFGRFTFYDPFPLVDGELELVAPGEQHVDSLLAILRHPLTEQREPESARMSRGDILDYLGRAPQGRLPAHLSADHVPVYHFWMRWTPAPGDRTMTVGGLSLRVGETSDIVNYVGHVGYNVYPPACGHHFAERSVRLILPLARRHQLRELWITANPDNHASRRTIERLGANLIDTVDLPPSHPLRSRGETRKCRYRLDL